jgi:hypothetical protein
MPLFGTDDFWLEIFDEVFQSWNRTSPYVHSVEQVEQIFLVVLLFELLF